MKRLSLQWEFQDPKMEVPTICKGYVRGYTPKIWPEIWYSRSILRSWNSHWSLEQVDHWGLTNHRGRGYRYRWDGFRENSWESSIFQGGNPTFAGDVPWNQSKECFTQGFWTSSSPHVGQPWGGWIVESMEASRDATRDKADCAFLLCYQTTCIDFI